MKYALFCTVCSLPGHLQMVVWWHFKALSSDLCRYMDSVANASSATAAALDAKANTTSTFPAEHGIATLRPADAGDGAAAASLEPELFYTDPRARAAYKLWVSDVTLRFYCCHASSTCTAWHGHCGGVQC